MNIVKGVYSFHALALNLVSLSGCLAYQDVLEILIQLVLLCRL